MIDHTVIFLLACLAQKSIRRHSIFLRSWLILHQQVHQIYTSEWKVLRNWWIFLGLKKKFSCYLFSKEYPLVYLFWNGPEQSLGKKYLSSYNNTRCFFSKINELTMRFPIVGIHLVTHAWIQYPIICIPTWKNWSKRLVVFTWNQFHEIFREIDFTKFFMKLISRKNSFSTRLHHYLEMIFFQFWVSIMLHVYHNLPKPVFQFLWFKSFTSL